MAEEPQNNDSSGDHIEVEGTTDGGWISWLCALEGNDFLVEIDEDFLKDPMNLFGLPHKLEPLRFKYFLI